LRSWDNFLVGHIVVMMLLCRIICSFIGYIVCDDIGVFPLRGSFFLCHSILALVVSISSVHTDIYLFTDLLKSLDRGSHWRE
jgi:hypothetical protein